MKIILFISKEFLKDNIQIYIFNSNNEHNYFYCNITSIDVVINQIDNWVWCEPVLYDLCWHRPILEITYKH